MPIASIQIDQLIDESSNCNILFKLSNVVKINKHTSFQEHLRIRTSAKCTNSPHECFQQNLVPSVTLHDCLDVAVPIAGLVAVQITAPETRPTCSTKEMFATFQEVVSRSLSCNILVLKARKHFALLHPSTRFPFYAVIARKDYIVL